MDIIIYSVSWDCNEDYTRAVISRGGEYDVQMFSGQGKVSATRAAVQDLPGRVIYETGYIPDFFSLRVFSIEGRNLQTVSKTVQVGSSCVGERLYVTYGGTPQPQPSSTPAPQQQQPDSEPPPSVPAPPRGTAPFVDPDADPMTYVARYVGEDAYRQWYDDNYAAEYGSICSAVGLDEGCIDRYLESESARLRDEQQQGQQQQQPPAVPPQPGVTIPPPPDDPDDDGGDGDDGRGAAAGEKPDGDKQQDDAASQPPDDAKDADDGSGDKGEEEEGGGCLVATAAYGSELAPQVQLLREVRDGALGQTAAGASFMSAFNTAYYAVSPAVADLERGHPWFREAVRAAIAPAVAVLSLAMEPHAASAGEPGGSEQGVLLSAAASLALIGAVYVAAPALAARAVAGRISAARAGRRPRPRPRPIG